MLLNDFRGEVTFSKYPHSAEWLLSVRESINSIIENN